MGIIFPTVIFISPRKGRKRGSPWISGLPLVDAPEGRRSTTPPFFFSTFLSALMPLVVCAQPKSRQRRERGPASCVWPLLDLLSPDRQPAALNRNQRICHRTQTGECRRRTLVCRRIELCHWTWNSPRTPFSSPHYSFRVQCSRSLVLPVHSVVCTSAESKYTGHPDRFPRRNIFIAASANAPWGLNFLPVITFPTHSNTAPGH